MSSHNGGSFSQSASCIALSTGAESQVGSPPDGREPASSYSEVVPALALALALLLAFACRRQSAIFLFRWAFRFSCVCTVAFILAMLSVVDGADFPAFLASRWALVFFLPNRLSIVANWGARLRGRRVPSSTNIPLECRPD